MSSRAWSLVRWSERSQVERVDLYTRQSFYLLIWLIPAVVLAQYFAEGSAGAGVDAILLAGALLLGLAATSAVRAAMELYPAYGPLPWREVGTLGALAVVWTGGLLVAEALVTVPEGVRATATMLVWSAVVWGLGGFRSRALTALVLLVPGLVVAAASGLWFSLPYSALVAVFLIFTIRVSLWLYNVVTELDSARSAQAALAVAEERLRFSRDLHDVLGRRLSTMAVQAELAANLARRGEPGAAEQMLEVRGVAHQALREARELVRGYRSVDLAQEVAGAQSLLASAGIGCTVAIDDLPLDWHEPAAWVIREAVTNVLRHSAATRVAIDYADGVLDVANDGVGGDGVRRAAAEPGNGLTGLAERLAPLGATLEYPTGALPDPEQPFVLRVRFPTTSERAPS